MRQFIKHYPISIAIAITIIYLSCFKPPTTSLEKIPDIDKIVHCSMYCFFSLLLWFEYLRTHHFSKKEISWHRLIIGLILPIILGCSMELVQKYLTSYRGFEWGDILANVCGAIIASLTAEIYIKYRLK